MDYAVELGYEQCRELLAGRSVGRVAVCTPTGPAIVPVAYVVDGDSLVFRTAPYSVLGAHAVSSTLAVEVDDLDEAGRAGWSVVAVGRGRVVDDSQSLKRIREVADPAPWVQGSRLLYIRVPWQSLTGRRIGAGAATMAW